MKKLLYLLFAGLLFSCNDWLDIKPENSVTYTNFFQDETDLEAVVTQINAYSSAYMVGIVEHQMWLGMLADEWTNTYESTRSWQPSAIMISGSLSPWKNYYDIIFLCNVLLENSSKAKASVKEERMNFWNGQAYFNKAMAYFMLSRQFGEAVITENSTNLSAYGKSSAIEVIDEAIRNAGLAYDLLPEYAGMKNAAGTTITSKQYGNKESIVAALTHMYAWKGSLIDLFHYEGDAAACYEKAVEYATLLIDKKIGNYDLQLTPEDLCTALSNMGGPNVESIYETELNPDAVSYPTNRIPGRLFVHWPVNKYAKIEETKTKSFRIYRKTVNEIYDPQEKRRAAYFYEKPQTVSVPVIENGQVVGQRDSVTINPLDSTYAYVYKWREGLYLSNNSETSTESFVCLKANQVVWRMGDIYLLRAECYQKLHQDNQAIADLNKIRTRAGAATYPSAQDTEGLQYAIFHERERELFGEGHRFYDIVRNGMPYIKKYLGDTFKDMSESDVLKGALFLYVPDEAFSLNDLMRQNAYWKQFEN